MKWTTFIKRDLAYINSVKKTLLRLNHTMSGILVVWSLFSGIFIKKSSWKRYSLSSYMLMIVCPCPLYLKVGFAGYKNPCFSFSLPLSQFPLSLSLKWEMDLEWTAFYIQVLGKEGVKTVATPSVKNQCRFLTGSVSTAVHCFLFSTSLLLNIPLPWFY